MGCERPQPYGQDQIGLETRSNEGMR